MTKFYVHYVNNSAPTLKKFKTLESAKAFAKKFSKKYPNTKDGYWVDFIVSGDILDADEYYQDQL